MSSTFVLQPSSNALFTLLHLQNHVAICILLIQVPKKTQKKSCIPSFLKPIMNNQQLAHQNSQKMKNVRSGALQLMLHSKARWSGARKSVLRLRSNSDNAWSTGMERSPKTGGSTALKLSENHHYSYDGHD